LLRPTASGLCSYNRSRFAFPAGEEQEFPKKVPLRRVAKTRKYLTSNADVKARVEGFMPIGQSNVRTARRHDLGFMMEIKFVRKTVMVMILSRSYAQ
jgi:hypothetical protein